MSLNKAIKYGKEHRKLYTDSRRLFGSCCNHGGCTWCESNRRYKEFRDREKIKV